MKILKKRFIVAAVRGAFASAIKYHNIWLFI
jgi:hypothetical protein